MKIPRCKECKRRLFAKGLCRAHYDEQRPRPVCGVTDCDRLSDAKGLCLMHYKRKRRTGDPNKTRQLRGKGDTDYAKFWSRVALTADDTRCWEWQGSRTESNYGHLVIGRKRWKAHRYAWFLTYGVRPKLWVLHRCDNPPCVNPSHLFLGTQQDNMTDMVNKGRSRRGEKAAMSKLTEQQVREILVTPRATSRWDKTAPFCQDIAKQYGISVGNLQDILHRKSWKHVQIGEE